MMEYLLILAFCVVCLGVGLAPLKVLVTYLVWRDTVKKNERETK